jgi:Na+-driven multidrug efflux pump
VITISLIVYGLNKPILGLYITDNPDAIQYGIIRTTYMTLPYFLLGLMDVATGALRGLGYSFVPMIISLMGACGLRILWIQTIFQIPKYHTLPVLYQIYPVSWFLTFFVSFALFLFLLRKKQKTENSLPQRSIA